MVFAATLLLCLFPFLIVVSALAGRPTAQSLTRHTGLNAQAAVDIGHLFASPAATTSAVVGTASMVFFVFGGIAAAAFPGAALGFALAGLWQWVTGRTV